MGGADLPAPIPPPFPWRMPRSAGMLTRISDAAGLAEEHALLHLQRQTPDGRILVGRTGQAGVRLAMAHVRTVSKHQARLCVLPGGHLEATDLGSTNGTFYLGERLGHVASG